MQKNSTLCALVMGLILLWATTAVAVEPVYFEPIESIESTETAVTQSHISGELTPVYYEPSSDARLLGEYFDGVSVNIIEHISDEWAFVDIHTFGAGGYGYMMTQDLVFGDDAAKIEKATMLFTANEDFILSTHAMGQSGEIGPFTAGTEVELIGLAVNEETGLNRPLSFEQATWHLKTGDETGFLGYRDDSVLTQVSP